MKSNRKVLKNKTCWYKLKNWDQGETVVHYGYDDDKYDTKHVESSLKIGIRARKLYIMIMMMKTV